MIKFFSLYLQLIFSLQLSHDTITDEWRFEESSIGISFLLHTVIFYRSNAKFSDAHGTLPTWSFISNTVVITIKALAFLMEYPNNTLDIGHYILVYQA